jgi:Peptidase family M28
MRRLTVPVLVVCALAIGLGAQPASQRSSSAIQVSDLKEWLTYVASDELLGRATYSEGLGLAAAYITSHLKEWGVKPAGDDGSYFQTVNVLGVRTSSRASVTVNVNGQRRTFKDGEGIVFPRRMGGKQTIHGEQIEFLGYGLSAPAADHDDYGDTSVKGKVVVWLGASGPKAASGTQSRRLLFSRSRVALERGAIATIGPYVTPTFGRGQTAPADSGRGGRGSVDDGDFTTAQRYDKAVPPEVTARDELYEFLFSASEVKYAALKEKAEKQEPLPRFALKGVTISVDVDADYRVTRTRYTRNIIALVEGSDPELRDTYVGFSAHYDHSGYREGNVDGDRILNGADDDGSGTVALMAIARAFAVGAKPKRSLLFVWHAAEENGLMGSRYNADYPAIPLERIVAFLNMDMVGRNRDDKPSEANTVYLVGSDRISTELHTISEGVNASLSKPLTLDYELNHPADPQSIYTRSDHYSYASKGIPIIFYTTGLHKDYHQPSDSVEKIEFEKMARVAELVRATGERVANLDHAPARDNKGPRAVGK